MMSRFAGTGVFFPVKCRQDGRYFHGVHHGREQEGDLDVDFELPHGVDEGAGVQAEGDEVHASSLPRRWKAGSKPIFDQS